MNINKCCKENKTVTEASPADFGICRLRKQESAGRFFGSNCEGEIFQLKVWISAVSFLFSYLVKNLMLTPRSILLRGTSGNFFRIFRSYLASKMRFEVEKTWAWNFSVRKIAIAWVLLNKIQRKMARLTDTNEENVWNFFSEFSVHTRVQEWDCTGRKCDLNFRKYTIRWARSIGTTE